MIPDGKLYSALTSNWQPHIPFKFQQYSQHAVGLIKEICRRSKYMTLYNLVLGTERSDDVQAEALIELVIVLRLQQSTTEFSFDLILLSYNPSITEARRRFGTQVLYGLP